MKKLIFLFFLFEKIFSQSLILCCQGCGLEQSATYKFCSSCGIKLDKSIVVNKIEIKIDSLIRNELIPITTDEMKIYIEDKIKLEKKQRSEVPLVSTETANMLDYLAPIVLISLFILMTSIF